MTELGIERIQDSVHGLMTFQGLETAVLEVLGTNEVQRLRRIKQLGVASYVYPSAEHSRLAHSLGTAAVVVRFGRHLTEVSRQLLPPGLCVDEEEVRDLALAALFHDLGHGPLSHALEREVIGHRFNRDAWVRKLGLESFGSQLKEAKWHEVVTSGLLLWPNGDLNRRLEHFEVGLAERVATLLRGRYHIPYLPRILSSDVDADRSDYLLRDSLGCGVSYGQINLDWLISTSTIGRTARELVIGFERRKAYRIVEQFLNARRALYNTVYLHRTVRCLEGMVSLFLRRVRANQASKELAIELPPSLRPLVDLISGEPLSQEELLSLDDSSVWQLVYLLSRNDQDPVLRDLGNRILKRHLFRMVPARPDLVRTYIQRGDYLQDLLRTISRFCSGPPEAYLVVDTKSSFEILSKKEPEFAYFVEEDGSATPVRDDRALAPHVDVYEEPPRIYTLPEAVPELQRLIESA